MNRRCGDCTLCCKLVPVKGLGKAAGERCRNQTSKGCAIYHRLEMEVPECKLWSCRWLVNPETAELRQPDRAHYVLDLMPDFVGLEQNDGTTTSVPVMQVWIDPDYPEAHRDPALRRYIEHLAKTQGALTLVRYGNERALVICAPCLNSAGVWEERESILNQPGRAWRNPMEELLGHV